MKNDQQNNFARFFNTDKIVSPEDIVEVLKGIKNIMDTFKKDNISLTQEAKSTVSDLLDKVSEEHARFESETKELLDSTKNKVSDETKALSKELNQKIKDLKKMVKEVEAMKPVDGKDADEEKIVAEVLEKIKLPEYEEFILDEKGEQIVKEINDLPTDDDDLKIDAKHIKNLPKTGGQIGGPRLLSSLSDVAIETPTNGQVLKWNSTLGMWANGTGGGVSIETPTGNIDGSNTTFTVANEPLWVIGDGITYFDGAGYTYTAGTIEMETKLVAFIRSIY